ncbi:MAG: 30S ribosomal protein S4 [Candidatus Liptonbacteria bacterium]|nr:30S ribosomal protein S4 [Candidatus Liptonbacteria bacterium]
MPGPKEKKERSLGERLYLKGDRCQGPKCALVRRPNRPGMHGQKRSRALSDFGRQLKEKQKFKLSYGLDERGLKRLFLVASRSRGDTANKLLELLESRLDNIVFRLGFAVSRSAARQAVGQGHIVVGGKRVRSPGYCVSVGETIGIYSNSQGQTNFRNLKESLAQRELPAWLVLEREKLTGKLVAPPRDPMVPFEVNLLVESFSK